MANTAIITKKIQRVQRILRAHRDAVRERVDQDTKNVKQRMTETENKKMNALRSSIASTT